MAAASDRHDVVNENREKWDRIYRHGAGEATVAEVLSENRFLLPKSGSALDLACGLGGNALLLAELGLQVQAWDISPLAVQALRQRAVRQGLPVIAREVDVRPETIPKKAFDVIVVARFLDRTLCDAIIAALKNGGLLFYQTFTVDKLTPQGPNNPAYLLRRNELLRLFAPLTVVYYREFARVGNVANGARNEAAFIGQKTD